MFTSRIAKGSAAIMAVLAAVVVGATSALAQTAPAPYTSSQAVTDSTGYIGQLTAGLVPVMLAIAAGIVGLAVLGWGLRTVFSKVRGAAHF